MRFDIGGRIVVLAAARQPFHNQGCQRAIIAFESSAAGASAAKWGEGWLFKSSIGSHVPSSSCWHSLFIVAVLLNFTNVVGRYLFGISLLGSDEVQVFIMVGMTFLGAVVVTRRNQHLRMDVLVAVHAAPRSSTLLRIAEQLLLHACWPASCWRSPISTPGRCCGSDAPSDMAGVPMWIRMASMALGFALILIDRAFRASSVARAASAGAGRRKARQSHDLRPRDRADHAAAARLSDLPGAAHRGDRRAGVLHERAAGGAAPEPVRARSMLRRCSPCRSSSMPAN